MTTTMMHRRRGHGLLRVSLQHADLAVGDHHAPVGLWRLHAQAEERDGGEVDHRPAEQDRALGDDQAMRCSAAGGAGRSRVAEKPLHLERLDVRL